jgi:hypothetical protein
MQDESVAGEQMDPPLCGGPQAEVILLAIAVTEGLGVEEADRVQAVAPYVHREADRGRQLHCAATIDAPEGRVQRREVAPERQRSPLQGLQGGITADRGVVGEGCDGADALPAMGVRHQPAEPAFRRLGIAVQQHDVVPAGCLHATVDAAHDAEILRVA